MGRWSSPHYDPMLAKVISVAPTRDVAARALAAALAAPRIHGVTTNRDLLVRVLRHPAFLAGDTDTAFFDRHGLDTLAAPLADEETVRLSALAAALADAAANRADAQVLGRLPSGWRNVVAQPQRRRFTRGRDRARGRATGSPGTGSSATEGVALVDGDARTRSCWTSAACAAGSTVAAYPGLSCVDSPLGSVALVPVRAVRRPGRPGRGRVAARAHAGHGRAGRGRAGRRGRRAGQPLLWLEAMKMQHQIDAPADGVVTELAVAPGDQVEVGRVLAVVSAGGGS